MTDQKIKISIVEDDNEFSDWIKEEVAAAANIEIVSIYDVGEDAVADIPKLRPDIVIMDLTLDKSEMDGIDCIINLKYISPVPDYTPKFLVMTSNSDEKVLFKALEAGAGAYIQKGDIPKRLTELLKEFYEGGAPMSPGIAKKIIERFHRKPVDSQQINSLTPREEQVLNLLAKGYLYKEVAGELNIAEGTVKQHAHNIYQKLQVNNVVEAIRKYLNM